MQKQKVTSYDTLGKYGECMDFTTFQSKLHNIFDLVKIIIRFGHLTITWFEKESFTLITFMRSLKIAFSFTILVPCYVTWMCSCDKKIKTCYNVDAHVWN